LDFLGNQHAQQSSTKEGRFAIAGLPFSAIAFLLLTTLVSLLWSHNRLLFRDEFYEMWTDRVSSIGQIIHIQRTTPVALDPLAYHLLAHACIRLFGANTFAIRLPALLGVLLMQVCLFIFIRRLATERAAVFAMGLPALTCVMGYSAEGRPYGLMLGLFGLAMVCWQVAGRRETGRTMALITLAASLAVALNTQYFGVLLLAPLCVAELFRTFQRRRLDLPMIASFAAGSAGIVFVLPFMKAAREFRGSYGADLLTPKAIVWPYIWTLAHHPSSKLDRASFAVVGVVVCLSLWVYGRGLHGKTILSYEPEQVFLVALAALPLFGYGLALFTSPSLEPRFVLGLVIGIAALSALGLFSLCQSDRCGKLILAALFVTIASLGGAHIWAEHEEATEMMQAMNLQPELKAALMTSPSQTLYIQDIECFASLAFFEPDPEVRSRIALVYSKNQEIKWNQESIYALTALHLHDFAYITVAPYESFASQPSEHIVVDFAQPSARRGAERHWNWIGLALTADHANVRFVGTAFRGNIGMTGDVLSVNFPPLHETQR
jgi:4-amino-4-deoxy-L-arabinose transferase-like glycosyltransferase